MRTLLRRARSTWSSISEGGAGELAAFPDARTRQGEALAGIGYARRCEMALNLLGPGRFVAKARFPEVPAALPLGRDLAEVPRSRWAETRYGELRRWCSAALRPAGFPGA